MFIRFSGSYKLRAHTCGEIICGRIIPMTTSVSLVFYIDIEKMEAIKTFVDEVSQTLRATSILVQMKKALQFFSFLITKDQIHS